MKNKNVKLFGIGGAGINTLLRFFRNKENNYCVDTDRTSFDKLPEGLNTIMLNGCSNANQKAGREAFIANKDKIMSKIEKEDVIILFTGLGGGTGSGILPEFVKELQNSNIHFIVFVTLPFDFEAKKKITSEALASMENALDFTIQFPHQLILNITDSEMDLEEAFLMVIKMQFAMLNNLLFDMDIDVDIPDTVLSDYNKVKDRYSKL